MGLDPYIVRVGVEKSGRDSEGKPLSWRLANERRVGYRDMFLLEVEGCIYQSGVIGLNYHYSVHYERPLRPQCCRVTRGPEGPKRPNPQ